MVETAKLANIYLFKVTKELLEKGVKYVQSYWRRSGVFIFNFEHISHLFLVLLLLNTSSVAQNFSFYWQNFHQYDTCLKIVYPCL